MTIDIAHKKKCVELFNSGKSPKEIYDSYYHDFYPESNYESFTRQLRTWRKKTYADDDTLNAGTYNNFIPYNATVHVDKNGEVRQAWIRQSSDNNNYLELLESIKKNTSPVLVEPIQWVDSHGMLEIPLYDMHFPLGNYEEQLKEILGIICKQHYEEINLVLGQDMFHNDDMRGRTSSGRSIEKVDMMKAWEDCKSFWYSILKYSLENSNRVRLIYSKGNHDESMSWAFVQMLKIAFPNVIVDDSFKPRKVIYWKGAFIGITHGSNKMSASQDLRGQFTIEFPQEFSQAKVREIHVGHLHHERESDLYGIMLRRLSTAVPSDNWSVEEGYVGSHKRFMLFEYEPNKLKAIYYI